MASQIGRGSSLSRAALRNAVRSAIGKHLDLSEYEVFIFGSEASATPSPRSDIDLGIRGPHALDGAVLQRIRAELEAIPTLRTFDVVDFNSVDPSFRQVALQHTEKL